MKKFLQYSFIIAMFGLPLVTFAGGSMEPEATINTDSNTSAYVNNVAPNAVADSGQSNTNWLLASADGTFSPTKAVVWSVIILIILIGLGWSSYEAWKKNQMYR